MNVGTLVSVYIGQGVWADGVVLAYKPNCELPYLVSYWGAASRERKWFSPSKVRVN